MKKRFQTGGNIHAVPASRQNAEPRTPSGVRPVSSPVTPVQSDVQGVMKHGGEVKSMKKPKKMAMGGMPAPMPVARGGKGSDRGSAGSGGFAGTGRPPQSYVGTAGNLPGGFMGGSGSPVPGGPKGQPGMRYPMAPTVSFPTGPQAFSPDGARFAQNVGQLRGGFLGGLGGLEGLGNLGAGGMPIGNPAMGAMPRGPAMKKGGKVSASSYRDMTGGAAGGIGRLEKSSIAAKTKSQKLKAGGKVKGYADGGLSKADVFAMTGKYGSSSDDESGRRGKGLEAYRARQDAAEKRSSAGAAQKRARKAMETPRNAGGGSRGSAEMKRQSRLGESLSQEMDLENTQDRDLEKNLSVIGRNSKNADRADKVREIGRKVAARNSMAQGALSNNAPIPGFDNIISRNSVPFIRDNGGNFSLGAYNKRMADLEAKRKAESGMKRGGMTKMAKGGKAEAFEGSAKDMSQDKKLAKKRGMSLKAWEKSSADEKHDTQQNMKGLKKGGHVKGCDCMACGGKAKYAMGGKVSTAQDGMKAPLRPKPTAMAKGGVVGKTFGKPLPGTKVSSKMIRPTVATGASMKKDGMKGQLRAKASGAKPTNMMKPLGMTKMASGGKVRGAGIAQRGTKFIGEV